MYSTATFSREETLCSLMGCLRCSILPSSRKELDFFESSFLVAGKTLGRQTGLLGENVLEELADAAELASSPTGCRAISILILKCHVFDEILVDLDILWRLSHLHEWSDVDRVVINCYHIVRSVHVKLNFGVLELSELILLEIIGERALGSAEVAPENQKLVVAGLMKKAPVDRRLLAH
jgi:hypothetical protein